MSTPTAIQIDADLYVDGYVTAAYEALATETGARPLTRFRRLARNGEIRPIGETDLPLAVVGDDAALVETLVERAREIRDARA